MHNKRRVLQVHPNDNVLVALQDLAKGETILFNGVEYILKEEIPAKHKFTTQTVAVDEAIVMYGVLVAKAKQPLEIGVRISTENIRHASDGYKLGNRRTEWQLPNIDKYRSKSFWVTIEPMDLLEQAIIG